jgi:hypothetical protein
MTVQGIGEWLLQADLSPVVDGHRAFFICGLNLFNQLSGAAASFLPNVLESLHLSGEALSALC